MTEVLKKLSNATSTNTTLSAGDLETANEILKKIENTVKPEEEEAINATEVCCFNYHLLLPVFILFSIV